MSPPIIATALLDITLDLLNQFVGYVVLTTQSNKEVCILNEDNIARHTTFMRIDCDETRLIKYDKLTLDTVIFKKDIRVRLDTIWQDGFVEQHKDVIEQAVLYTEYQCEKMEVYRHGYMTYNVKAPIWSHYFKDESSDEDN